MKQFIVILLIIFIMISCTKNKLNIKEINNIEYHFKNESMDNRYFIHIRNYYKDNTMEEEFQVYEGKLDTIFTFDINTIKHSVFNFTSMSGIPDNYFTVRKNGKVIKHSENKEIINYIFKR